MLKRVLILATAVLLTGTMGCTTVQKWAAGGAVVGAATGATWAELTGGCLTTPQGAMAGAAVGGLAGALVGDFVDEKAEAEHHAQCEAEIKRLKDEIASLNAKLASANSDLDAANRKIKELEAELARLRSQGRIALLEITVANDVLFRSGSARLSSQGREILDQAASKINSEYKDKFVMIEGHTDTQPIKHSGWKSNWELGAHRSLAVLHYLIDKGVDPKMLCAATFSEYQPVADNSSPEGMSKNRRSAIVVYEKWTPSVAK